MRLLPRSAMLSLAALIAAFGCDAGTDDPPLTADDTALRADAAAPDPSADVGPAAAPDAMPDAADAMPDAPDAMLDAMPDPAPDATPDAAPPPEPGSDPAFAFPIDPADRARIHPGIFFGVDHNPNDGPNTECTDYAGRPFPFCYDGHQGSDFVLDGGFATMDAGSARVTAAAGGVVIEAVDGNFDRCSGSLQQFEPDCDGHPIIANKVVIAHANGWRTRYLHLMRDSVAVAVGDPVDCGDLLGRVGSSGRSFTPHLHFEVVDPDAQSIDPFAGEVAGPRSLWVEQRAADLLPGPACHPRWSHPAP